MTTDTETPDNEETTTDENPGSAEEAGLLDAVSAAVDAETVKPAKGEGEEGAEEEEEAGGKDEEGKDEEGAEGEDKEEGEEKPGTGDEGAEKTEKPAPDPINDPIPEGLKKETRERMEALIGKAKEATAAAEKVQRERDELIGTIAESGATGEQFGQALDYLRMVNSGDPAEMRKALKVMREETAAIARMLGEPVEGVDLLEGHADLKEAVEQGDMSAKHAAELAAAREQKKLATERSTATRESETQERQYQQAVAQGRADLNALEAELKADPAYAAKKALIVPILKPIMARAHPSQWRAIFKGAYEKAAAPAAPAPRTPSGQPLRGKQPAGRGDRQPKTMAEAVGAALDDAGQR